MKQQLDAARKAENKQQITQLEKRLAQTAKQLKEQLAIEREAQTSEAARSKRVELIAEAYLRTLSRFPTSDEVQRCEQFFSESADLSIGLSGVMWALINTKEFVVNH
jgi:hypothetical protein